MNITKITKFLAIYLMAGINTAYAATFFAEDGPVQAYLAINEQGHGYLQVEYTGYLYVCSQGPFGISGTDINLVFVYTDVHGERRSVSQRMFSLCQTPYDYTSSDVAQAFTSATNFSDAWNALIPTFDFTNNVYDLEVAFESTGQWDSRYGENYHLSLQPIDE